MDEPHTIKRSDIPTNKEGHDFTSDEKIFDAIKEALIYYETPVTDESIEYVKSRTDRHYLKHKEYFDSMSYWGVFNKLKMCIRHKVVDYNRWVSSSERKEIKRKLKKKREEDRLENFKDKYWHVELVDFLDNTPDYYALKTSIITSDNKSNKLNSDSIKVLEELRNPSPKLLDDYDKWLSLTSNKNPHKNCPVIPIRVVCNSLGYPPRMGSMICKNLRRAYESYIFDPVAYSDLTNYIPEKEYRLRQTEDEREELIKTIKLITDAGRNRLFGETNKRNEEDSAPVKPDKVIRQQLSEVYERPSTYPKEVALGIIEKHLDRGESFQEIADRFGVHDASIRLFWKKHNTKDKKLPNKGERKRLKYKLEREYSEMTIDQILDKLYQDSEKYHGCLTEYEWGE